MKGQECSILKKSICEIVKLMKYGKIIHFETIKVSRWSKIANQIKLKNVTAQIICCRNKAWGQ